MVNSSFVPGFNAWYVLVPAMLILNAWFGTFRYSLDATGELRIRRVLPEHLFKLAAIVIGLLAEILIVSESWLGLKQIQINRFGPGSRADAMMAAIGFALTVAAAVYAYVVYKMGVIAGNLYFLKLRNERQEIRRWRRAHQPTDEWLPKLAESTQSSVDEILKEFLEDSEWDTGAQFVRWYPPEETTAPQGGDGRQ
ncbi:hypothetical protein IKE79_01710 [Candidatus Saccharibacteria bacterium]|nr:hypothetical protein [Candidatus Saccharibacteria bacterium]